MKQHRLFVFLGIVVLSVALGVQADPPGEIDYQGKILVDDIPLTGDGYFKYAVSDEAATTNYWSQDGTTTGEPSGFVTNACYNGVFSVALGSSPMTALDPDIFSEGADLVLRVWFSSDGLTFNEMLPSQELLSSPYAINADQVDGYDAADLIAAAQSSLVETDPVFLSSDAFGITSAAMGNWNTAYGWGDHAGMGYLTTEVDPLFNSHPAAGISLTDTQNWTTAYGWGDHATRGYLTTEVDPLFNSRPAAGISSTDTQNWATAYGWGDHATRGYLTAEIDPTFTASDAFSITASAISQWNQAYGWGDHSLVGYAEQSDFSDYGDVTSIRSSNISEWDQAYSWGNHGDEGYLTQFDFSDFSAVSGIDSSSVSEWDQAYSWGDHGAVGYLEQYDFSDFSTVSSIDSSSVSWWDQAYGWGDHSAAGYAEKTDFIDLTTVGAIWSSDVSDWNEAYDWGDHSTNGYLTTETDPVWTVASTGYYQKTEADARYVEVTGDTMTGALLIDDAVSGTLKLDSSLPNIALGAAASAAGGTERIAIGHLVANDVDNTARIRGMVYMDGGDSVWARSTFGSGSFKQLLPLPDIQNIVYVATNGSPAGPGTIDRPFDTPQSGYNYAATAYPAMPVGLVIASGTYPGLNMNAGHIHVFGESRPELMELTVSSPAVGISGKQRVENLIVTGLTEVTSDGGSDVKFHNCRLESALQIAGPQVELQDCFVSATVDGLAVRVYSAAEDVAFYNSSFINDAAGAGTITVSSGVDNFEIMGCQIHNKGGGSCIVDNEPGPITPTHLYTHNYLYGAAPGVGTTQAMYDPFAGAAGPTITFTHNLVMGHVGFMGNSQFYANNTVYGLINIVAGTTGWTQAGAGTGADAAGNIEHETTYPTLPSPWLD